MCSVTSSSFEYFHLTGQRKIKDINVAQHDWFNMFWFSFFRITILIISSFFRDLWGLCVCLWSGGDCLNSWGSLMAGQCFSCKAIIKRPIKKSPILPYPVQAGDACGWAVKQDDICCVSERSYLSVCAFWHVFGFGLERLGPAVSGMKSVELRGRGRWWQGLISLFVARTCCPLHAWDAGSWEEGSEVQVCGGESTEVDVWMDTKVMFSCAESYCTPPLLCFAVQCSAGRTACLLHF